GAVAQHALAALPGNPLHEGLRFGRVLAGSEHAGAGNADERARILVAEVVQRDVVAVLAGLRLIAEVVVVIDDRASDFTDIDALHRSAVATIGDRVFLHRL